MGRIVDPFLMVWSHQRNQIFGSIFFFFKRLLRAVSSANFKLSSLSSSYSIDQKIDVKSCKEEARAQRFMIEH